MSTQPPPIPLTDVNDDTLAAWAAAIVAEQRDRALAAGSVDAIAEAAFETGFDRSGAAGVPWLEHGLLVCPGYRRDRSKTSHDCRYVSVDGQWVWQRQTEADASRQLPGVKPTRQSVTVLFAAEGSEIDVVTAAAKGGGPCRMVNVQSFAIERGQLVPAPTRFRLPEGHR